MIKEAILSLFVYLKFVLFAQDNDIKLLLCFEGKSVNSLFQSPGVAMHCVTDNHSSVESWVEMEGYPAQKQQIDNKSGRKLFHKP